MTRYTKLEGKKRAPLKASDHFGDVQQGADDIDAAKSTELETATSDSSESNDQQAEASEKEKQKETEDAVATKSADTSANMNDPVKMAKRAKLLRLKAKKAKSEDKRKAYLKEAKQLDRRAAELKPVDNVQSGPASKKRKVDRNSDAVSEGPANENPWKKMERERREVRDAKSEYRKQKRAQERNASLRCFACRGPGHSARECPNNFNAEAESLDAPSSSKGNSNITGKEAVGICFRCGSTEHILAKCTRPQPKVGAALPFATCFVCSQKGHLASTCPENKGKGVYPNGGCCKLCQSVEHLAKDCPLRKESATAASVAVLGEGDSATGSKRLTADEDDFHHFARKKQEVERESLSKGGAGQKRKRNSAAAVPFEGRKVVTF